MLFAPAVRIWASITEHVCFISHLGGGLSADHHPLSLEPSLQLLNSERVWLLAKGVDGLRILRILGFDSRQNCRNQLFIVKPFGRISASKEIDLRAHQANVVEVDFKGIMRESIENKNIQSILL